MTICWQLRHTAWVGSSGRPRGPPLVRLTARARVVGDFDSLGHVGTVEQTATGRTDEASLVRPTHTHTACAVLTIQPWKRHLIKLSCDDAFHMRCR